MDVTVVRPRRLLTGGTVAAGDFADIAPCQQVRWNGDALTLAFATDLTQAQVDEVKARCDAVNDVEKTLRARALTAIDANKTYLALAPPTQAQVVAQVRALTAQMNGLIRIGLAALDTTD